MCCNICGTCSLLEYMRHIYFEWLTHMPRANQVAIDVGTQAIQMVGQDIQFALQHGLWQVKLYDLFKCRTDDSLAHKCKKQLQ